ncbi:hypothetical protein [Chryseobacterium sp.]|uniref:hypothetical protein n=1 Tax=Chryseobacterium sp. TaxID=1871047 RepID=UPI0025BDDC00|nr:hypothetical protein [Chryseobacterium sp.]
MRKIVFIFFILNLFLLQSCSFNSEVTYYKDSTSTITADLYMKEMITSMKSMFSDSLVSKKDLEEIEKFPRTWTSVYDFEKMKDGKVATQNPDSIRLMKKVFMKSNFEDKDFTGISLKMDRFSPSDYDYIKKGFSKTDNLPVDINTVNNWNGKNLIINTENFNKDMLPNIDDSEKTEEALQMVKMMYQNISVTLKFENKIKSITGKHDWVIPVDDHTVKITYDMETISGESKTPLTHADKKIVIVTE